MPRPSSQAAPPTFFATAARFRVWLERHHETAVELLVGFYKVDSGLPSMSWSESVDQALCFGWIDGVRRARDEKSYTIRFTPRRPKSNWSAINIAKLADLERRGLMRDAGRAAAARRLETKSKVYAYEQRYQAKLDPADQRRFKHHRTAWAFFQRQPPSYRHTMVYWVASARKPETRAARLGRLVEASANHTRVGDDR